MTNRKPIAPPLTGAGAVRGCRGGAAPLPLLQSLSVSG
jgi:hypothetical protein